MRKGVKSMLVVAALAVAALPAPAAAATPRVSASSVDYDCADFANQAEAEEYLLPGDPYRLDADHDGIACEDLPCPCSSSPGSSGGGGGGESTQPPPPEPPPPPPEPPELSEAAARRVARHKANRFARHHRVRIPALQQCGRKSRYRVDCRFIARGRRSSQRTVCRMRAIVTGEGSNASAVIHGRCHTTPVLSFPRAMRAIRRRGAEVAGRPAELIATERIDLRTIDGTVEWSRTKATPELCRLEVSVSLSAFGDLHVRSEGLECERAST